MSTEPRPPSEDPFHDPQGFERLPGLASVAASASFHASTWALAQSLRASRRLASAVTSPSKAADLAGEVAAATRDVLNTVIALTEDPGAEAAPGPRFPVPDADEVDRLADAVGEVVAESVAAAAVATDDGARAVGAAAAVTTDDGARAAGAAADARSGSGQETVQQPSAGLVQLRHAGEELLRRSADLHEDDRIHPAYERILGELSPDEARVLRLLLVGGPQPSVDVRTGGLLGFLNTHVIKRGLTMVGARAGLRYTDQLPAYLNNLFRLGLIWVSTETIRDHQRYQVLEAQPEVSDAMRSVRRAQVVRRSIHLTPFGEDFCRTCLAGNNELRHGLPAHSSPKLPPVQPRTEEADPLIA